MLLAFQRLTDDVDARFRPSAGARHVTPLAETAFVAEEEEGVVDGCALGGVAGEGVGVVEVLGCVEGVDVFELAASVRNVRVWAAGSRSTTEPRVPLRTPQRVSFRRQMARSPTRSSRRPS